MHVFMRTFKSEHASPNGKFVWTRLSDRDTKFRHYMGELGHLVRHTF